MLWSMEFAVNLCLLLLLAATTLAITRMRRLIVTTMLFGIFSLLMAAVFVVLDAVDVAFTEASVGAGISTILMLATLAICGASQESVPKRQLLSAITVLLTGAILLWGVGGLPNVGDPESPASTHVYPRYVEESGTEIGVPNIVTSVLASYRGYDTLGEVTVIFTAGLGIMVLIGAGHSRRRRASDAIGDAIDDSPDGSSESSNHKERA